MKLDAVVGDALTARQVLHDHKVVESSSHCGQVEHSDTICACCRRLIRACDGCARTKRGVQSGAGVGEARRVRRQEDVPVNQRVLRVREREDDLHSGLRGGEGLREGVVGRAEGLQLVFLDATRAIDEHRRVGRGAAGSALLLLLLLLLLGTPPAEEDYGADGSDACGERRTSSVHGVKIRQMILSLIQG